MRWYFLPNKLGGRSRNFGTRPSSPVIYDLGWKNDLCQTKFYCPGGSELELFDSNYWRVMPNNVLDGGDGEEGGGVRINTGGILPPWV